MTVLEKSEEEGAHSLISEKMPTNYSSLLSEISPSKEVRVHHLHHDSPEMTVLEKSEEEGAHSFI